MLKVIRAELRSLLRRLQHHRISRGLCHGGRAATGCACVIAESARVQGRLGPISRLVCRGGASLTALLAILCVALHLWRLGWRKTSCRLDWSRTKPSQLRASTCSGFAGI